MSDKITLITCTGGRPEAFELCQKYMEAQTVQPDQWIVVHDMITKAQAKELQASYPQLELYAGPRTWKPGLNTQRFNMEEALKHVEGDIVLFIEDDDFYAPEYIETMVKLLQGETLIAGLSNNKYYNLAIPGWKEMGNYRHSSLCTTAVRKALLPMVQAAVDSGELYFDMHLWASALASKTPMMLKANSTVSVGIKGLPGKAGIGAGHRFSGFAIDPNLLKLKEWLQEGAQTYMPYIKKFSDLPAAVQAAPAKPAAKTVVKPIQAPTPAAKTAPIKAKTPVNVPVNTVRPQNIKPPMGVPAAAQSQRAAMAMLPQSPGMNPQSAELTQSVNTYPTGERSQGEIFK
jgi:hypothetical protein